MKKNSSLYELEHTLKEKVLGYLSTAPRTFYEIKKKYLLYSKKLGVGASDMELMWQNLKKMLEDTGLVKEDDIAQSLVLSQKIQSKNKLYQKLVKKGIPKDIIKTSIVSFSKENELEGAKILAEKKHRILTSSKRYTKIELKQKIFRFLVSKGYDYEITSSVVDTLPDLK